LNQAASRPEVAGFIGEAPAGLAMLDQSLRFTYANRAFAAVSCVPLDSLLGRPICEALADFPELEGEARAAMASGRPTTLEVVSRSSLTPAGFPRHWHVSLQPVSEAGQPSGLGIVATDVTDAAELRAQTQLQAERSQVLADFLGRAARFGDDEGRVLELLATLAAEVGGGACAVHRVSADGRHAEVAAYHDIDAERLEQGRAIAAGTFPLEDTSVGAVILGGESLLVASVANAGLDFGTRQLEAFRKRFALLGLVCTRLRAGSTVIGAMTVYRYEEARPPFDHTDVTFFETLAESAAVILDVARAHCEMADTARRLALIVDGSPLATILVDRDFRVRLWNRAAEEMFGWSEAELLGQTMEIAPPELKDEIAELRRNILDGAGISGLETRRLRRDGTEIGVAIYEAPLRDAGGAVTGALLLLANTVERKRLEAELVQARKMEMVGRLAGGVAHDFNNIMTVLLGYSSLLETEADDPAAVRQDAELIGEAVRRAGSLTRQLLTFSRRQEVKVSVLDANETVLSMKPLIARLVGERIEVLIVAEEKLARIHGDQAQLQQVLLNLAANGRDAMPDGGRLIVRTGLSRFDRTSLSRHFEMPAGDYVTISVTDTGTGMDEETQSHLFEPYFTTKGEGLGTGLGLATSYNVIKQSGGHISVYSEPGHGSTFRLYFPAVDAPADGRKHTRRRARRRTGRVLLVEDQVELRALTHRLLADAGFDVVVAGSPEEALEIGRSATNIDFDLLFSDVIMPGMTGPELAGRLHELKPDLAVLLVSGHTAEIVAGAASKGAGFLAKPFTPDELLDAVDKAMARSTVAAPGVDAPPEPGAEPEAEPR
jgi:two-component system, cell cycle sensor histidine kinase and response regulator CckA